MLSNSRSRSSAIGADPDTKPTAVLRVLATITTILCFLSLALNFLSCWLNKGLPVSKNSIAAKIVLYNLTPLFSVDVEKNIPTFYSSSLFLAAAFLCYITSRKRSDLKHLNASRAHLRYVSLILLILSFDEYASYHEHLPEFLHLGTNWPTPALAIASAVIFPLFPFFLALPLQIKKLTALAATIYITGAAFVESIGIGIMRIDQNYTYNAAYIILSTIEEFFEMIGIVLFIYAIMVFSRLGSRRRAKAPKINLSFQPIKNVYQRRAFAMNAPYQAAK